MNPNLAERILKFPDDIRKSLAEVPGPGWRVNPRGHAIVQPSPDPYELLCGYAWWPANPADALRAVLGYDTLQAYERVTHWILTRGCDDHEAAVAIIEWSLS